MDGYINFKATITVPNIVAAVAAVSNNNKKLIFNTKIDNAKDIDIVIPMCNLIDYSNITQKHQLVYDNTIEMNKLQIIIKILLMFMLITIIVFCSNLNNK